MSPTSKARVYATMHLFTTHTINRCDQHISQRHYKAGNHEWDSGQEYLRPVYTHEHDPPDNHRKVKMEASVWNRLPSANAWAEIGEHTTTEIRG